MEATSDNVPVRGLGACLAPAEIALTAVEGAVLGGALWVSVPATFASTALPVAAGLCGLATLWSFGALRPVAALLRARQRQVGISAEQAGAGQRALARVPRENAALRLIIWMAVAGLSIGAAVRNGDLQVVQAGGLAVGMGLCAAALAAVRVLVLDAALGHLRPIVLPNLDGMKVFSACYRAWLGLGGMAILGGSVGALWLMAVSFVDVPRRQMAALALLVLPVLVPSAILWERSLRRRTAAIEMYFDVVFRAPGTRGPARDEPKAVAAFLAAQSLPYRLAGYQAFAVLLGGVLAVGAGRWLCPLDIRTAELLLLAVVVVVVAGALVGAVGYQAALRPLMKRLGSRHHLPVTEIRSRFGLRAKLLAVFVGVGVTACGFLCLYLLAPPAPGIWPEIPLAAGEGLALALAVLVSRGLVMPIVALEARSEEMARGELARPVPPSGEADEIGRLSVAFEEMRRSLRDRLRSTESINVDLEREVRRRTEALEQRNAELRTALDQLRMAQDNLIRSEKLASMGRLVAGIAHEINNPVNAVINSLEPLEQLVRELHGETDARVVAEKAETASEMLTVIQRGATRTKAIVQALHNYSRGDEHVRREVNLGRSIDDTLDLLRHRLRNVTVKKHVDPAVRVLGFPGQIDQVLMNLVTNAAQALGDRGGVIRVEAARKNGAAVVSVSDDGPGIPPDVLPRIFDPFFTTKDVGEGSGLGLSIVHGIVERHGGRIDVDSAPGRGTTFTVVFPADAGQVLAAAAGAK